MQPPLEVSMGPNSAVPRLPSIKSLSSLLAQSDTQVLQHGSIFASDVERALALAPVHVAMPRPSRDIERIAGTPAHLSSFDLRGTLSRYDVNDRLVVMPMQSGGLARIEAAERHAQRSAGNVDYSNQVLAFFGKGIIPSR